MATQLLIDTDVLIDYLRDYPDAVSYVEAQQERLLISVVTMAELMSVVSAGVKHAQLATAIVQLQQSLDVAPGPMHVNRFI